MTTLSQSTNAMADSDTTSQVTIRSSMRTDVGVVRDHNEDCAYVDPQHGFFVVADGMGGHAAGEIASAMAVDEVRKALEGARDSLKGYAETPTEDGRQGIARILEGAVRDAHKAVFERGVTEPDKQGMGTTLDVVLIAGNEAFVAHVGDSRTYLMRGGSAAQITTDHTVAEVLVIEGKLSPEEALVSPLRTILVNALGVAAEVGVEMAHLVLQKDDKLLLCSDGLHDYFPKEQDLYNEVTGSEPADALKVLVETARNQGGHDNITGVIIDVVDAPALDARGATIPIPVLRDHSDGVPQPVGQEETLPVDGRADTPPEFPVVYSHDNPELEEGDARATLPIRVHNRQGTEDGIGDMGGSKKGDEPS